MVGTSICCAAQWPGESQKAFACARTRWDSRRQPPSGYEAHCWKMHAKCSRRTPCAAAGSSIQRESKQISRPLLAGRSTSQANCSRWLNSHSGRSVFYRGQIEESIDTAQRTREEADQLLAEYRARLREAREQADEIVQRARQTAEVHEREAKEQGHEIVAEASQKAQRDIEAAHPQSTALSYRSGKQAELHKAVSRGTELELAEQTPQPRLALFQVRIVTKPR